MPDPQPSGHRRRARASERLRRTRVLFDNVEVFYFPFAQGTDTVPSGGGIPIGMEDKHQEKEEFTCREYERVQSLGHAAAALPQTSGTSATRTRVSKFVMPKDSSSLEPLGQEARAELLKTNEIDCDPEITAECERIAESRESCGCSCVVGDCKADSCSCFANGIECQIENEEDEFPCACKKSRCGNPNGRREHNSWRIKEHLLSTLVDVEEREE
ncbi:Cysteine/serine-rich nuclear protein 3 [Aphelenchoides fujianensis]|nr:Cysteine/serine-rich nuclear protein 3 [Aphelenchoides fujianensis]